MDPTAGRTYDFLFRPAKAGFAGFAVQIGICRANRSYLMMTFAVTFLPLPVLPVTVTVPFLMP